MKKFLAVLLTAAMLMGMMAIPAFATGDATITVNSPADNAVYFDEDVVISITATNDEFPVVTFDGEEVELNVDAFPECTATVSFADKALGLHDIVVSSDSGETVKRTVKFCSNIVEKRFLYKFFPEEGQKLCVYNGEGNYHDGRAINNGTFEQIEGSDGKKDGAFKMTKTGGDSFIYLIHEYVDAEHPTGDSLYSVSFDVKKGNDDSVFDLEGKSQSGYAWLGKPEAFIGADGSIDNSGVKLPVDEWHNIELVWELVNQGNYWVYLDKELIYTGKTTYDYSSIYLTKFQMKNGSMNFDNVSYGKYIINPDCESVGYYENGKELAAMGNVISTGAEKIVLNLSAGYTSTVSVKVNGVAAANVETSGKKLIVTPAAALPANEVIDIEVGAGAVVYGATLPKSVIYKVETGSLEFSIASPADNATYFDEDVEISIISPSGAPTVTFDGAAVTLDASEAPSYKATVSFADKALGHHDVVIEADGKKYERSVEFYSNIVPVRFINKFFASEGQKICIYQGEGNYYDGRAMNQGTLEEVAGSDGKTDGAFKMTKTGGDAYFQIIGEYATGQHPTGDSLYSIAFDVKRAEDGSIFDLEGKSQGGYAWLGKPEAFIGADGSIDNSGVKLPAGEWHNIELVWEQKNQGNYWVYLDGEMIHTQETAYDYSSIYLMKFQMKQGGMYFDNVTYGKYIVNPRLDSVSYTVDGNEKAAVDKFISPASDAITLNLTDAYDAATVSGSNVTVNGIAASKVEIDGNKMIVTPAASLEEDAAIDIKVGSGAAIHGEALTKDVNYRVYTGSLADKLISFKIVEGNNSDVYAKLDYSCGFESETKNIIVIIGAYVGDRLVDVRAANHPVSAGVNNLFSEMLSTPSGTTVKAYAWGADMSPIAFEVK